MHKEEKIVPLQKFFMQIENQRYHETSCKIDVERWNPKAANKL